MLRNQVTTIFNQEFRAIYTKADIAISDTELLYHPFASRKFLSCIVSTLRYKPRVPLLKPINALRSQRHTLHTHNEPRNVPQSCIDLLNRIGYISLVIYPQPVRIQFSHS